MATIIQYTKITKKSQKPLLVLPISKKYKLVYTKTHTDAHSKLFIIVKGGNTNFLSTTEECWQTVYS